MPADSNPIRYYDNEYTLAPYAQSIFLQKNILTMSLYLKHTSAY
jgi:hypothetical protein